VHSAVFARLLYLAAIAVCYLFRLYFVMYFVQLLLLDPHHLFLKFSILLVHYFSNSQQGLTRKAGKWLGC
jgi:hypothetical protein